MGSVEWVRCAGPPAPPWPCTCILVCGDAWGHGVHPDRGDDSRLLARSVSFRTPCLPVFLIADLLAGMQGQELYSWDAPSCVSRGPMPLCWLCFRSSSSHCPSPWLPMGPLSTYGSRQWDPAWAGKQNKPSFPCDPLRCLGSQAMGSMHSRRRRRGLARLGFEREPVDIQNSRPVGSESQDCLLAFV